MNYPCTFLSGSIEIKSEIIIFGGLGVSSTDPNNAENKDFLSVTNNLIRLKSYKLMQLDIEISKSSNL